MMKRTYTLLLCALIMICVPVAAGPSFGSIGKSVSKGYKAFRKTIKKAEKDARKGISTIASNVARESVKAGQNLTVETRRAGRNIERETVRVGPHLVSFGKALVNYTARSVSSVDRIVQDANQRILEGKLADALFHVGLDPLTAAEENAFRATQESGWIRSAGAIAATAYGGAAGAAAYASWQTYRATNGNAELALRAGIITGLTSMANTGVSDMKVVENFDVVKKSVLAGAVGGIAIAASGGDDKEVLEGFVLAGGAVIIQDGYRNAVGHELDARASTSEPYCVSPTSEGCQTFEDAFYIDEDKNPRIDYAKLDNRRAYVGQGYMPRQTRPDYSWTQDRSPFMQAVSKVPGFNAMALFHDNWVLSWAMNDAANKATILPAIVMTYYGTGHMLNENITQQHIGQSGPQGGQGTKLLRNDLLMEPDMVLAGTLDRGRIPKDFDADPNNSRRVEDHHVVRTGLVAPGKYLILRNVANGKLQRVVNIGALPPGSGTADVKILLSPLTLRSLGIQEGKIAVVQAEPEEAVLVSTVDPPAGTQEPDMTYFRYGDKLHFPDLDVDETSKWTLTIMGPGGAQIVENFNNNWTMNLPDGQFMYALMQTVDGQLPWGYYGFFKISGNPVVLPPGIWAVAGNNSGTNLENELLVNGHRLPAWAELDGTTGTISTEDESLGIILTNLPATYGEVNGNQYLNGCNTCLGIMITDVRTAKTYLAVSGSFARSAEAFRIDVAVQELENLGQGNAPSFRVKGRFKIDQ